MSPRLVQGVTVAVCLVIAAVGFFGSVGPYGWMFGLVGLALAALGVVALIKNWSIFSRPGPF